MIMTLQPTPRGEWTRFCVQSEKLQALVHVYVHVYCYTVRSPSLADLSFYNCQDEGVI